MSSSNQPLPPSRHGQGWPLLAVLFIGVVGVAIAWAAVAGPLNPSEDGRSFRYVEAIIGAPSRINPLYAHLNDTDRDIASLVFSGLTRLGSDGEVLPDLAQSWEISDDNRAVTFHLRQDVFWHTGIAFTSADVLFTYGLLADPLLGGDPDQAPLWRQLTCNAPDNMTVTCQLPEPFAPFLAYATTGILPKHVLEGTSAKALAESTFNQKPVGTGPYRVVSIDQEQAILKAEPRYHLGAPPINEIQLRFYPDSSSAAVAVVRGEAQGILLGSGTSEDDFDAVSAINGFRAISGNRSAYTMLYLNNEAPPFNDKRVRQAVLAAVDTDAIIGDLLGGRAVRASSPIPPGTWAFNPELEPVSRDQGEARRLLEEAEWTLPENGDVRTRNGVELRITLMTDKDELRGALAETISEHLANIGIAAVVVREEPSTLVRNFLIPREYQAAIYGLDPGPDPDPYPAWHSSQATDSGRNLAAYVSEDADAMMEEARRTKDLGERQRLYYSFQQLFRDDVPSVVLYYPVNTYFVSEQVGGIQLGTLFNGASRFRNVQGWSIKEIADIRDP